MQVLAGLFQNLPFGTNLGLLQFMWMLVNGAIALQSRGPKTELCKRAVLPMHGRTVSHGADTFVGMWQIAELLRLLQAQIEELPQWRYHQHGGYRAVRCRHYGFLPSATQGMSQQTLLPSGRQGPASGDHGLGCCQR